MNRQGDACKKARRIEAAALLNMRKKIFTSCAVALATAFGSGTASAEQGDDNPTGVTGIYNGNVSTAGSYDPLTGNSVRSIDEISVPAALGAYGLKWTRTF